MNVSRETISCKFQDDEISETRMFHVKQFPENSKMMNYPRLECFT